MTPLVRVIDHTLYPRQALAEARTAYREYCSVRVEPLDSNRAQVTISVLPAHADNHREVALSFLNFALDKALEIQLAAL